MTYTVYGKPARTRTRRIRTRRVLAAGVLVVIAANVTILSSHLLTSSPSTSSTATSAIDALRDVQSGLRSEDVGRPGGESAIPRGGALGEADGSIPDGATVFDDEHPGVANLDSDLLGALHQAANDAADDGVEFFVTSGWRSTAYQERLLQEAVSKYGSEQEAARWVATPDTSTHVAGDGVDVGSDAATWLSGYGAAYGLCQIYGNEPWHYELRPEAVDDGCPAMYADPTDDPRMQQ